MIQIDFDTVHRLASVGSLVEPLRRAFRSRAISPERTQYDLEPHNIPRTLLLMPAWQPDGDIGVKIATVFPDNAHRGLPSVNAAYLLLSGKTGQPRAWIDGRALTLIRTAAVSALASDLLAPATPGVLLMVGPGALSRYLIEGHLAVRKYQSVLIWGRDRRKAADLARDLEARGWPVSVAGDLETAARSADVISCATLSEQPLIKGVWLKSTCHLDLVGSFKPDMREADDDCMRDAFIAVDTLAALEESGDLIVPLERGVLAKEAIFLLNTLVSCPIDNLLDPKADFRAGQGAPTSPRQLKGTGEEAQRRPARKDAAQRVSYLWDRTRVARNSAAPRARKTVFKSVGVAHADLAVAEHLFERSTLGV